MENLLKAQKSLENIEDSIAQHLSLESIEGAHAWFLSALDPSNQEAAYLLKIGLAAIQPLTSCLKTFRPRSIKSARGGSPTLDFLAL